VTTGSPAASALELRGVHKRFGDVSALDGVDFRVGAGTVHALLGENGAGKSTLMRVAFGLLKADAGAVSIAGRQMTSLTVRDASRAGLGMVHQHLSLAPGLDAAENISLGGRGAYRPRQAVQRLRVLAQHSGLDVPADARAGDLSIVQQQRLEILKALAQDARVLILDEPTAVLAPPETADLMAWIRRFAASGGSVVLVTHKLREALTVADDITVLRRGRVTYTGPARASTEAQLAQAIFPDVETLPAAPAIVPAGDIVVSARGVGMRGDRGGVLLHGASFDVRRHEIVGLAAVEGSGHRALIETLAALRQPNTGDLQLPPRVAFIPADRQRDALIADFSVVENVALSGLGAARGLLNWSALAARSRELIKRFSIAAVSETVAARTLSGGNQQRLVVARALERPVDLVVADNPTRGLDVQASAFVHDQLRRAAAGGAAVVVHSSDLDEVLALATRVLVVFRGEVRECALDRAAIGRAMLGAA
jgi:simple sugar transport system ATP-binding protein